MDLDAVVLAESGLRRARIWEDGFKRIDPEICIPAPGQGTLAIQVRVDDERTRELLAPINSDSTETLIRAERACLDAIGGDCHTPFAAWAEMKPDGIRLTARLFRGGEHASRSEFAEWITTSAIEDAEELGHSIGRELIEELGGKDSDV
jgi:hydroxymethylbilane synthase